MTEPIQPALTPEEWLDFANGYTWIQQGNGLSATLFRDGELNLSAPTDSGEVVERRHALAALCLYGQPYGFTQEDVDFLAEEIGGEWDRLSRAQYAAREKRMRRLIARIAALLPPTP